MFGSIYGPGVLNDTIVPGYPITEFPMNLQTFWSLPNATTRNFGGATQYVTYPEGYPDWMYQLGRNITDPNHISQWNPMLFGTGFNFGYTTNPALTQAGQDAAYQWGYNLGIQQRIQQAIQGIASALSSMESQLTNVLKSDKLTSAQKATLQGLLEDVKALKTKIENQLKDKNPTQDEVTAMQKEVLDLQKKIGDAADKIRTEVNEGGASDGASASGSAGSGSASSDSTDLTGTKYENIDPETGRHTSIGDKPSKSEVEQFCSNIYSSVVCAGTNHEVLDATVQGLNEGNIIEVIDQWEKAYGKHTATGNDGFFARIFDDVGDDWQSKFVPVMLSALTKRAEALGIYDEISEYVGKVNKGLATGPSWKKLWCGGWMDDHQLANDLMAIYNKIKEKEAANKAGVQKAIKGKKSQKETEVNNRKNEVINEKKNEIANKLKEALKLKETPALSSALKIETDDNGEFTGYSIELNTQNGKVKVTGCTYQQLALAIENNGLKVEDVLVRKTQA